MTTISVHRRRADNNELPRSQRSCPNASVAPYPSQLPVSPYSAALPSTEISALCALELQLLNGSFFTTFLSPMTISSAAGAGLPASPTAIAKPVATTCGTNANSGQRATSSSEDALDGCKRLPYGRPAPFAPELSKHATHHCLRHFLRALGRRFANRSFPLARERPRNPCDGVGPSQNARTLAVLQRDSNFPILYADALRIAQAKDRIPAPEFVGGGVYNFWQDAQHVRGIWRRTTVAEFAQASPSWTTVLDLDAIAGAEKANWVWKGADCAWPRERSLHRIALGWRRRCGDGA